MLAAIIQSSFLSMPLGTPHQLSVRSFLFNVTNTIPMLQMPPIGLQMFSMLQLSNMFFDNWGEE